MTKMKLNLELEQVKYMEQEKITNDKSLTWRDSFKLFFLAYFSKGEFNSLFLFLIFQILGSIKMSFAFLYSLSFFKRKTNNEPKVVQMNISDIPIIAYT